MRVVAEPSFIVDVTEDLPTKLEALACLRVAVLGAIPPTPASSIWWPGRPRCGVRWAACGAGSRSSRSSRSRIRSVTDLRLGGDVVHAKPALPAGHGEVLTRPAFEEWARSGAREPRGGGVLGLRGGRRAGDASCARLPAERRLQRGRGVLGEAGRACRGRRARRRRSSWRPGISPSSTTPASGSRTSCCSDSPTRRGATALDLVVDSDGFEVARGQLAVHDAGRAAVSRSTSPSAARDACYAVRPVPSERDLELTSAPPRTPCSPRCPRRRCGGTSRRSAPQLQAARPTSPATSAELVTIARRRYEAAGRKRLPRAAGDPRRAHARRFARSWSTSRSTPSASRAPTTPSSPSTAP